MIISYDKLRGRIAEKGYTLRSLSDKSGIAISTLSNKMNGITEFKTSEILILSRLLEIANIEDYFFNVKVRNIERNS